MYCFLFYLGGISFGYVYGNWGFVFVCLLMGVGVAASCQIFKALKLVPTVITGCLEVISLWIPAIVG